ncbi:hypothetical protein BDZ94DRAFT_1337822, partial [Collybia nuda]
TSFLQFSIQYCSIALLYYDYVLTFGMEVKYMWSERFRLSTALYIFCRYGLVANIVYLLTIAGKITLTVSFSDCDAGYKISSALSVLGRFAIIVVWGGRTWAVCGKNRYILAFFGIIGLLIMILDIVPTSFLHPITIADRTIVGGLLSIFMVIFEISSATITTSRAIQALRVSGPWGAQKKGFMYLLLEQGTHSLNSPFSNTTYSIRQASCISRFLQRLLNAITLPLSGMMTARFLLHLRKWEAKHKAFASKNGGSIEEHSTGMDFASAPNQGGTRSALDMEFGEDPVHRARNRGIDLISMGEIAETRHRDSDSDY